MTAQNLRQTALLRDFDQSIKTSVWLQATSTGHVRQPTTVPTQYTVPLHNFGHTLNRNVNAQSMCVSSPKIARKQTCGEATPNTLHTVWSKTDRCDCSQRHRWQQLQVWRETCSRQRSSRNMHLILVQALKLSQGSFLVGFGLLAVSQLGTFLRLSQRSFLEEVGLLTALQLSTFPNRVSSSQVTL